MPAHMTAAMGEFSVERKMAMGAMLIRQGDAADHVYLVCSGMVSVELYAPGRDPIVLDHCGTGDILGWSWLCPPFRWGFDARVVEPSTVIAIDAVAVRKRFDADPALGYEVLGRLVRVMAVRLQSSRERMVECVIDRS